MSEKKEINFTCTLCDSDIPIDDEPKVGDVFYCSYCKSGLKVVEKRDGILTLEAEADEEG